jgi:hypothetical protein
VRTQVGDAGVDVGERLAVIQRLHQLEAAPEVRLAVAELHARFAAVKQIRRQRVEAGGGEPVADRADMAVDAEDFLDDHHAARGLAGGGGQIRRERAIGGLDGDVLA